MSVNKTVFASKAERANYYKLSRTWDDHYCIWHNLPFLNIFDVKHLIDVAQPGAKPLKLTNIEMSRLKKTSVDYTLCDENDQPLLCIEFDGMQKGFNTGIEYHPTSAFIPYTGPDDWRQQIMELKLKVAFGSFFPFFVVGYREFDYLASDVELTIVDGIIGEVLATRSARERIVNFDPEALGLSDEEFDELQPWEQQELIQDWVISIEAEAELEHNPVDRQRWLTKAGTRAYRVEFLSDPDLDEVAPLPQWRNTLDIDREALRARSEAFGNVRRIGAKVTLHTNDIGDVSAVAWVPNFQSFGFSGYSLVEDIAYILASEKAEQARRR